jgi:hypothetical protein
MKYTEFNKELAAIPDQKLSEMAHDALAKLCSTGGRSLRMSVPPRTDDTDIILGEIIRRFDVNFLHEDFIRLSKEDGYPK